MQINVNWDKPWYLLFFLAFFVCSRTFVSSWKSWIHPLPSHTLHFLMIFFPSSKPKIVIFTWITSVTSLVSHLWILHEWTQYSKFRIFHIKSIYMLFDATTQSFDKDCTKLSNFRKLMKRQIQRLILELNTLYQFFKRIL